MTRRFSTSVLFLSVGLVAVSGCATGDNSGGDVTPTHVKDSGTADTTESPDSQQTTTNPPTPDSSVTNPPVDSYVPPDDTYVPPDDTYTPPQDTGTTTPDTGTTATPTGGACTASAQCQAGGSQNVCMTWLPVPACGGAPCTNAAGTNYSTCAGGLGVCRDDGTGKNTGYCLPKCTFGFSGGATSGCLSGDVCIDSGQTTSTGGYGTCMGGRCKSDADCTDPSYGKCQVETMGCTAAANYVTYPKHLGDACTYTAGTYASTDCFCFPQSSSTATAGVCTVQCITGSTTNGCPTGYQCDPLMASSSYTAIPNGLVGFCFKKCAAVSDCTVPATSCYNTQGGTQPICLPN